VRLAADFMGAVEVVDSLLRTELGDIGLGRMNDFVDPKHRGVNLPPGYKDLIDVFEGKRKESGLIPWRYRATIASISSGGLAQAEKYLQRFFASRREGRRPFLHFITAQDGFTFLLLNSKNGPLAVFSFPIHDTVSEKSVRRIFAKAGINPVSDEAGTGTFVRAIQYLLPNEFLDAHTIVANVLKEAYAVTEKAGLRFSFRH
jgi:hypothetical protein